MQATGSAYVEITTSKLAEQLHLLRPKDADYATVLVERLLSAACERPISDIHFTPSGRGLDIRWRADGVLEDIGTFSAGEQADVVARLKVMADLLTYRQETPQEGRLQVPFAGVEMRISTFPTLFGERAVVRIFRQATQLQVLDDLQLPLDLVEVLRQRLLQTQGAVMITGPAGSGKTTTAYGCLREIMLGSVPRSIVTLEDPIESVLPGVAQSAMQPTAGFDFAAALRSVMRQDPEVILVGEVRDHETAIAAFQAALTGHLVVTTFHAGSAATAVSRFSDMGIEPYLLRSGIQLLLGQRLVRRLCSCSHPAPGAELLAESPWAGARNPQGCSLCAGTGYKGRMLLAEVLPPLIGQLGTLVLAKADAPQLEQAAVAAGMINLGQRAIAAVDAGQTSAAEVIRVLGLSTFQRVPNV